MSSVLIDKSTLILVEIEAQSNLSLLSSLNGRNTFCIGLFAFSVGSTWETPIPQVILLSSFCRRSITPKRVSNSSVTNWTLSVFKFPAIELQ